MKRPRLILPLFFLALLFAQLGGLTHGIAHALSAQSQDQPLPQDNHCDLCATYAQIGNAVGSDAVHFDFPSLPEATYSFHSDSLRSAVFAAFAARAPPRSA